jgi:hypothetical protein
MKTLTLDQLKAAAGTTIFTVKFIKRGDGSLRTMNAMFGVRKHLKGGTLGYEPAKKNLMGCYDVKGGPDSAPGYKMINLETLIELRLRGTIYTWKDGMFIEKEKENENEK